MKTPSGTPEFGANMEESCDEDPRRQSQHKGHPRRKRSLRAWIPICVAILSSQKLFVSFFAVDAFRHNSCTSDVAKQFQFADCYLPELADDLLLSKASFLMSHDAATGYLKATSSLIANGATNLYTKTQIGSVYQQLEDGARALDVRPKLLGNGTVVLHHGAVPIAVTLERLVSDARKWAEDNPSELVLILHSNFAYPSSSSSSYDDDATQETNDDDYYYTPDADTTVEALSNVYSKLGVNYVECSDLYGLTVREAKELAVLSSVADDDGGDDDHRLLQSTGGYLLAMDRHDAYAGSCAKQNWVEDSLVTCYSGQDDILPCTDRKSIQHQKLKEYAIASANNEPTDSNYELGPPASEDYYPLNEIQTLWQVDTVSAALGVSHFSSIIDDNKKSHLNARVVDWIYDDAFDEISLLVADQVRLNGNAITSVLRNRCGQSELSYDQFYNEDNNKNNRYMDASEIPCGTAVGKPHLRQGKPLSTLSFFLTTLVCVVFGVWMVVFWAYYQEHHDHEQEIEYLKHDLRRAANRCACSSEANLESVLGGKDVRRDPLMPPNPLPPID